MNYYFNIFTSKVNNVVKPGHTLLNYCSFLSAVCYNSQICLIIYVALIIEVLDFIFALLVFSVRNDVRVTSIMMAKIVILPQVSVILLIIITCVF